MQKPSRFATAQAHLSPSEPAPAKRWKTARPSTLNGIDCNTAIRHACPICSCRPVEAGAGFLRESYDKPGLIQTRRLLGLIIDPICKQAFGNSRSASRLSVPAPGQPGKSGNLATGSRNSKCRVALSTFEHAKARQLSTLLSIDAGKRVGGDPSNRGPLISAKGIVQRHALRDEDLAACPRQHRLRWR